MSDFKAEDFITKGQLQTWLGIKNSQRLAFHDLGLPYMKIGKATLYHLPAVCAGLKTRETARPA